MSTELVIERVFDAPRELVWKALTDPDQVAEWFGPEGYHVPRDSVSMDIRPGGHQRLEMVPDSDEYPPGGPTDATVDEVVALELLVTHEEFEGEMAEMFGTNRMSTRIELHDDDGKTRLVVRQGPYKDDFAGMAREGWQSSFTKLDRVLAG